MFYVSYLRLWTPRPMNNLQEPIVFINRGLTVILISSKIANFDLQAQKHKILKFWKYKTSNISIYKSRFWIYVLFKVNLMSNKACSCIIQCVSMFYMSYLSLWTPLLMNNLQQPIVFINWGSTVYIYSVYVQNIFRFFSFKTFILGYTCNYLS